MRNYLMAASLALVAVVASTGAWAADGNGEVPCEIDLAQVTKGVDALAGRISDAKMHQLRQQIDVAANHCKQSGDYGETDISQIRQTVEAYQSSK